LPCGHRCPWQAVTRASLCPAAHDHARTQCTHFAESDSRSAVPAMRVAVHRSARLCAAVAHRAPSHSGILAAVCAVLRPRNVTGRGGSLSGKRPDRRPRSRNRKVSGRPVAAGRACRRRMRAVAVRRSDRAGPASEQAGGRRHRLPGRRVRAPHPGRRAASASMQYGIVSEENSETIESGTSSVSSSSCGTSPATTGSDSGSRRFSLWRPYRVSYPCQPDSASGPCPSRSGWTRSPRLLPIWRQLPSSG
jgi:hypothetical protein